MKPTFIIRVRMIRRRLLAVVGVGLALALVLVGSVQHAQAAQGQKWDRGMPFTGIMQTSTAICTVTAVSQYLLITAEHCGRANPRVMLNFVEEQGRMRAVKKIVAHPRMDVQAVFLHDPTGLEVTPLSTSIVKDVTHAWGYGRDRTNEFTAYLSRVEFNAPELCNDLVTGGPDPGADQFGELCWSATAENSTCQGDSGGPVIQNGHIVAMVTGGFQTDPSNCGTVFASQALTVRQMESWLTQMIDESNPFD